MSTIFISFDLDSFKELFQKWLPEHIYKLWSRIIQKIGKILFVELKLIVITTIQTIIGLFVLGINNSLTIGIICGILDLLPIVGPAVIFVPYILYELVMGRTAIVVGLVILYTLLQLSREFIKAKLVGENLKMHPFVAIFSIYLGVLFFGISGVIVGPTLIVVISELSSLSYK